MKCTIISNKWCVKQYFVLSLLTLHKNLTVWELLSFYSASFFVV